MTAASVAWCPYRPGPHFTGQVDAYVGELVVSAPYERRGIGRALMARAELWAGDCGLEHLTIETGAANVAARTSKGDWAMSRRTYGSRVSWTSSRVRHRGVPGLRDGRPWLLCLADVRARMLAEHPPAATSEAEAELATHLDVADAASDPA